MRMALAILSCGFLTACSTTVNLPETPMYHPAHAEAMAAPPPGPPSVMAATSPPVADPGLPVGDRAAHAGHSSMPEMDTAQLHVHKTEVSTAVRHPDPGKQMMPGDPGVMYGCQVHPDVMSQTPGQCPKCGLPLSPKMPQMQHDHMDHGDMEHGDMEQGETQGSEMQHGEMEGGAGAQAAIAQAGLPLYACPHHPEMISSFAGPTCPKCGMSLELVEGSSE